MCKIHSLDAICKVLPFTEDYYYEFIWKAPTPSHNKSITKVSRYSLIIKYGQQKHCFQLSSRDRKFVFNKALGFEQRVPYQYALTAEPVPHAQNLFTFHQGCGCPCKPEIMPLQDRMVPKGSNVTFQCMFEYPPFPDAEIMWKFSRDVTCKPCIDMSCKPFCNKDIKCKVIKRPTCPPDIRPD